MRREPVNHIHTQGQVAICAHILIQEVAVADSGTPRAPSFPNCQDRTTSTIPRDVANLIAVRVVGDSVAKNLFEQGPRPTVENLAS